MPSSQDQGFFVEQNDFSVILARTTAKGRGPVIEELVEAPLVEKSAIEEAVKAIFPQGVVPLTAAAIRPSEDLHLATADEGKRFTTPAAVQKFGKDSVELAPFIPGFFAVTAARDGAGTPWLLAATTTAAHAQSLAALEELQLKANVTASVSMHAVAGLVSTLKARNSDAVVLCLDLGALNSHALIVTKKGVEAAGTAPLSLDAISEAVQLELGLKFKGSAGKLFFNELYDFSETGPKIAGRLAPAVKSAISGLAGTAPTELFCSGLPAKQQWLATHLAPALGLSLYSPDIKAWCGGVGITFANPTVESNLSSAWIGFLNFVQAHSGAVPTAWNPEWISFDAVLAPAPVPPPPVVITPPPAPAPKPTPVAAPPPPPPPPPPAPKPAAVVTPPPKPAPAPAPAAPAPKPTPTPAKPAPAPAMTYPPKPAAAAAKPAPTPAPASAAKPAPTPAPAPKPAPAPAAKPAPAPAPAPVAAAASAGGQKKSSMGLIIGIVVALLVIGGGAFFYVQSENNKKKEAQRVADENAAKEKRVKEEAEKARLLAEQKAREDEAARKKRDEEYAAKLAAAEAETKRAQEEAKAQVAARLAAARGTVVVTTEPAGATVTLGSLPPQKSPATFETKIGTYPLIIALVNHDEVKTEVEVKENSTTQLPVQKLVKIVGAIDLTSDPAGVDFELHPANGMMVAPDLRRSGKTPAKADNLQPGDYVVTFTREGWQPHTETVKVERDGVAKASASFPNGVIKITSSPDGATITRNGVKIGVTPLTLSDQQPGNVRFELSLAGYENAQVTGRVESGKLLNLATPLLSVDRLATLAELDEKPKPIATPSPDLPVELSDKPGKVLIEFTVTKTGATKDVRVLETSSAELGKLFVEAVTKWKFKPGSIGGKPMNARVQQPFVVGSK